jgi:hypothetical protein
MPLNNSAFYQGGNQRDNMMIQSHDAVLMQQKGVGLNLR